jgi:hypothetical protein
MTSNINQNSTVQDDPFLIHEDEKVFGMLLPLGQPPSKFEEIVAMIAYSQYALQKHQFVSRYRQEQGRSPSEEHVRSIVMMIRTDNSLGLLKQNSDLLLKKYAQEYLEQAKREEILEPIEKIIKENTNFWTSVFTNLVAGLNIFSHRNSYPFHCYRNAA